MTKGRNWDSEIFTAIFWSLYRIVNRCLSDEGTFFEIYLLRLRHHMYKIQDLVLEVPLRRILLSEVNPDDFGEKLVSLLDPLVRNYCYS